MRFPCCFSYNVIEIQTQRVNFLGQISGICFSNLQAGACRLNYYGTVLGVIKSVWLCLGCRVQPVFPKAEEKCSVSFSDSALGSGEMGRRLDTLLSSPHIVEELQPSFSNETQKKYTCSMCGYSVSRLDNYKRHMRRHTGQMHQCDVCGAQFVCKYGMQKHKEQKHGVEFVNYDDTPDSLSLAAMFSPN